MKGENTLSAHTQPVFMFKGPAPLEVTDLRSVCFPVTGNGLCPVGLLCWDDGFPLVQRGEEKGALSAVGRSPCRGSRERRGPWYVHVKLSVWNLFHRVSALVKTSWSLKKTEVCRVTSRDFQIPPVPTLAGVFGAVSSGAQH